MGGIGFVARRDFRRRWRRVLLLTVVVGAVGAFALASAAGARSCEHGVDPLQGDQPIGGHRAGCSADFSSAPGARPRPGVAAFATLHAIGLVVPSAPDFESIGAPTNGRYGTVVDNDRIVAGRRPNPEAVDEVTLGEGIAARLHLRVGDELPVESYTKQQVLAQLQSVPDVGAPAGPQARLRVVAIVRQPLDLGDQNASGGLIVLTPAFDRAYSDRIGTFGTRIRIRTDNGAADVPRVLAESRRIFGQAVFSAQGLAVETQGASDAIDVLTNALWIAALFAAAAGAVAIGIMLTREIALVNPDQELLRALGSTCPQRTAIRGILRHACGGWRCGARRRGRCAAIAALSNRCRAPCRPEHRDSRRLVGTRARRRHNRSCCSGDRVRGRGTARPRPPRPAAVTWRGSRALPNAPPALGCLPPSQTGSA